MIDITITIDSVLKMVGKRNTSYKLFLMKYLINNIKKESRNRFSFYEMSCGMVSEAWQYYEKHFYRFSKNDRIFDLIQCVIENDEISIFSSKATVYEFLYNNKDVTIKNKLKKLMLMPQYRLLTPFIQKGELTGLTWKEENKKIEKISTEQNLFYRINKDSVQINDEWSEFICSNRQIIINELNKIIDKEYEKK